MSNFIVRLADRPPWWRRKARREWERRLAVVQAIVDANEGEISEQVRDYVLDLMLYGSAVIVRTVP